MKTYEDFDKVEIKEEKVIYDDCEEGGHYLQVNSATTYVRYMQTGYDQKGRF